MLRLIALGLALAGPVRADDGCHDLWFARNAIMDRAGHCFGTVLGQAVFDNAECLGQPVALSPGDAATVARIRQVEAEQGCRVDTSRPALDVGALWIRRALIHQPVRDIFESACLGWLGPDAPLFAGHERSTPVIGQIGTGSYVLYAHEPVGTWSYVTVSGPDWVPVSGGWLDRSLAPESCADIAG